MNVILRPQQYMKLTGQFCLDEKVKIYSDAALTECAKYFARYVEKRFGTVLSFSDKLEEAQLQFCTPDLTSLPENRYCIHCLDEKLGVHARDSVTGFYAVQTLIQIFSLDRADSLPCYAGNCFISDEPVFAYRALTLDVARHFFPVEEILSIVDFMAAVKLNCLCLHLSDDNGFRMQIDKYPEINAVASYREGSQQLKNGKTFVDDVPYGGFYTKAQLSQIVSYAAQRHVEVVPEFCLPGRSAALIAAFPDLGCRGVSLSVKKSWGASKEILCAGNDKTYQVVKDILDETCEVFPSRFFRLGDYFAPKDRWCNCPVCIEKANSMHLSGVEKLQSYMLEYFADYLAAKGKIAIIHDNLKSGVAVLHSSDKLSFDRSYADLPVEKTYHLRPETGLSDKPSAVVGYMWTEYIGSPKKLQYYLYPRMLALAECAWGTNKNWKNFRHRAEQYFGVYEKSGVYYNKDAFKRTNFAKRMRIKGRFLHKDADVEFDKSLNGEDKK